mmetsp:Transcript_22611/g.65080  ORF Transcript_22611/g.65080 Transcript_22611/m.65080 type:complete len:306 (-) Transcript_22611:8-925(-)
MREARSRGLALPLDVSSVVLSVVVPVSSVVVEVSSLPEDEPRKEDRRLLRPPEVSSVDVSSPSSVVVKDDSSDDPARKDERRAALASSPLEVSSVIEDVDVSPRVVVLDEVDVLVVEETDSSTLTPLSWAMSSKSFISRPYLARNLTMSSGASPTPPDMYSALASSRRRWKFLGLAEEPARRPPAFLAVFVPAGEVEKEKSMSKSNVLERVVAAPTAQTMVPAKRTRLRRSRLATLAVEVMAPPPCCWKDGMDEGAYFCRLRLLLCRDRRVPAAGEKREVDRCVMLESDDCEESSEYICWDLMVG